MELDIGIDVTTDVGTSEIAELAGPSRAATVRMRHKRLPRLGSGFRGPTDSVDYGCLALLGRFLLALAYSIERF